MKVIKMNINEILKKFLNKSKLFFESFNMHKYKDERLINLKNEIKHLKESNFNNVNKDISFDKIDLLDKKEKELKIYKESFEYKKKRNIKTIVYKDLLRTINSSLFAFLTIGLLIWMITYIFSTGSGKLTLSKIFGNYQTETYSLKTDDSFILDKNYKYSDIDLNNENSSKIWGVRFKYLNVDDKKYVAIDELSNNSPFNYLVNAKDSSLFSNGFEGLYIQSLTLIDDNNILYSISGDTSINDFIFVLDSGTKIIDSTFLGEGGGFRGSLLNTFSLIGLSLLFAFPLGVGGAVYLGFYAKDNRIARLMKNLIDMTSGIPSIIFGLAGALIFIPIASVIPGSNGGNLISGSLTLMMILLPTIVKTVEESIRVIPKELTNASLALGASRTETVFKIIIPNALPGMLTSLLLSIGRIIGESAALVFAMGTTISEIVSLNGSNASLAVHIWVILGGDHPAYDNACAISIVIIFVVLILTLLIKLTSIKLNKFKYN